MRILPAIDLYEGKAVRLIRGDYEQMTVYNDDPAAAALSFKEAGAECLHVVDLEGARDGTTSNFNLVKRIVDATGLEVQVGGGVRSPDIIEKYLGAGVKRVILGTAAITRRHFVSDMVREFGDAITVSIDTMGGLVAIKGWTELSDKDAMYFCRAVEDLGVKTIVCTDISKDGLLGGTNLEMYRTIREKLSIDIIASGGITSLDEIKMLSELGINGAILGKALYAGAIKLEDALNTAKEAAR